MTKAVTVSNFLIWKRPWRNAEPRHRGEIKEILLQHREYLHDWMKLHHVAQIRKDVHTIPGVNPE